MLSLVVHGELTDLDEVLVLVQTLLVDLDDDLLLVQTPLVDLEEVELEEVVRGLVEVVGVGQVVPDEQEVLSIVVAGVHVQVLQLVVTLGLPAVVTW